MDPTWGADAMARKFLQENAIGSFVLAKINFNTARSKVERARKNNRIKALVRRALQRKNTPSELYYYCNPVDSFDKAACYPIGDLAKMTVSKRCSHL